MSLVCQSFRTAAAFGGISVLLSLLGGASAHAQTTINGIIVLGSANPYLAGMPNGSTASGDTAPAQSPTQVTLTGSGFLTFSVTGSVSFGGGTPTDPPDGSFNVDKGEENGLSGYSAPADALVGVFLDNTRPDLTAAPAALNFSGGGGIGTAFTSLSPDLKQVFFIGDGLTDNGTGTVQQFNIPMGATRLFLGTVDGFGWFNNSGQFTVSVTGPVAAVSTAAPEPASLAFLGMATLPLMSMVRRRKT